MLQKSGYCLSILALYVRASNHALNRADQSGRVFIIALIAKRVSMSSTRS